MGATVIRVQAEDFSPGTVLRALGEHAGAGAVASFLGIVRSDPARPLRAMTIEHYPGMTERAIDAIAGEAVTRFGLLACTVIHRHGTLAPGERIVMVAVAAPHRGDALSATGFLIDWLKTRAPFWKKEHAADGSARWVAAAADDERAAARWGEPGTPAIRS